MESKMTLFSCLVAVSMWLPVTIGGEYYGAPQSYQPAYQPPYQPPYQAPYQPSYQPSYQASYTPPPYYEKPQYYETVETKVDYRDANNTRRCGVQPTVHRHGLNKDKVTFGEYPWVVAILDTYNGYKASGVLITPRHVLTAGNGVQGYNAQDLVVRVGDYDLLSDKNYLEVYKNYEVPVCKKHFYYSVPEYGYKADSQYGYASAQKQEYYQANDNYDVVILELSEDVDLDQYPQVEPICLPEFYYRSASVYKEYYEGYGTVKESAGNQKQEVNKEGNAEGLECWVVGYSYSPTEEFKYQTEKTSYNAQTYTVPAPAPAYGGYGGYGYQAPNYYPETYTKYVPAYSYESYTEYSLTPRRAKVHKVYEDYYKPPTYSPAPSYGYGYNAPAAPAYAPAPYEKKENYENWEADYYYDTCRADVGSAVMCRVPGKYEEEDPGKAYESYVPYYQNSYVAPSYTPSYSPAPYTPTYSPPSYTPTYSPPSYSAPAPYSQKYKRGADYYQPPQYAAAPAYYAPQYSAPSYNPPPYSAPYSPPAYNYGTPLKYEESFNDEYRRFAVYGVVEYPTLCSTDSYEPKKLKVTPIEKILPWILNVINLQKAQCYAPKYEPSYTPAYEPPAYAPVYEPPTYYSPPAYTPAYEPPAYTPAYEPPTYYSPPPVYTPAYEPPTYYSPPPPAYTPTYEPPTYYSPPPYAAPAYEPTYYSPPPYAPSYEPAPYQPSYAPAPQYQQPSYQPSYSPPAYQSSY